MATLMQIIDSVIGRLNEGSALKQQAAFVPGPLNAAAASHPEGGLFVQYAGSTFAPSVDAGHVMQPRTVALTVNVLARGDAAPGAALDELDRVRRRLTGFRAPDCRAALLSAEKYVGETAGLLQYAVEFALQTVLVEEADITPEANLTVVNYEETR